jgi:DNA-binding FrmR family transcriptional regulator
VLVAGLEPVADSGVTGTVTLSDLRAEDRAALTFEVAGLAPGGTYVAQIAAHVPEAPDQPALAGASAGLLGPIEPDQDGRAVFIAESARVSAAGVDVDLTLGWLMDGARGLDQFARVWTGGAGAVARCRRGAGLSPRPMDPRRVRPQACRRPAHCLHLAADGHKKGNWSATATALRYTCDSAPPHRGRGKAESGLPNVPTTQGRSAILNRLKSVDGHLRGVIRMVEEDAYCMDVLKQLQAVQGAIGRVNALLLQDHLQTCVTTAIRGDETAERERVIGELLALYEQGATLEPAGTAPARDEPPARD